MSRRQIVDYDRRPIPWQRRHTIPCAPRTLSSCCGSRFGAWLDSLGFPFGLGIAWGVTLAEILGTPLLALRRFVFPLCCIYMAIYATGLVLVQWPAGWFVVGLGRNGMEYSVLLLVCLAAVAWQDAPRRR